MIVICTKCKAKFRVTDARIGPRGAKVRCSRCHTVFAVSAPAPEAGELEKPFAGAARSAPAAHVAADPFGTTGVVLPLSPPPLPAPPQPPLADDPFAAAPPEALEPVRDRSPPLQVTDLSQLLGDLPAGDVTVPDDARPEPGPARSELDMGGLSLEDRTTPAPSPVAASMSPFDALGGLSPSRGADRYSTGIGEPHTFDTFDFGPPGSASDLALATETAPAPPPLPAPASHVALAAAEAPAVRAGTPQPRRPAPEPDPEPEPSSEPPSPPRAPRSHLRSAVVNAFALAALLSVTLAILVVWRGDGAIAGVSLRTAALLDALGRGAPAAHLSAVDVRSGVYEREKGPPLLFVRGKVVSRAPAAVRAVRVRVEVMRPDGVVARGEALAGAVPTPEELYQAAEGPALAAVAKAAAARAPREIRPGEAVPFLVPVADAPADLDGASVRVELASSGATR